MSRAKTINFEAVFYKTYARATTSNSSLLSQKGMSLTLESAQPVAQYANGDYCIIPATAARLTATSPASVVTSATSDKTGFAIVDREINGMGLNVTGNPFDSWESNGAEANVNRTYSSASNVALGIDAGTPLDVTPGKTLVKSTSITTPNDRARPAVEDYMVVHVADKLPAEGQFRPPVTDNLKDIPPTWRVDQIDWSKVPRIDTTSFGAADVNWALHESRMSDTWQTWVLWGNGARNIVSSQMAGVYRQSLGRSIGLAMQAITTDADPSVKEKTLIGIIQLGIDQAGAAHRYNESVDSNNNDPSARYDIGRMAPTALAALLLPNNEWILEALMNVWRWQDQSSYQKGTQANIDKFDDDTGTGLVTGQLGYPDWIQGRPEEIDGVTASNWTDSLYTRPLKETYRKIAFDSQCYATTAFHLFADSETVFPDQGIVHYNDRWNNLVEAGWPRVGVVDSFGVPTGYQEKGNNAPPEFYDWFREVRSSMTVPVLSGLPPERPDPPNVTENGTQLIIKPTSPYVGHGADQTQMDVRYVELSGDPLTIAGTWIEISNVNLNIQGEYIISPSPAGGLTANAPHAVGIRYRNANGTGAWSRNIAYGKPAPTSWVAGIETTTTEKTASAPSFDNPPTIESFFAEGAPMRLALNGISGFPQPDITYQWDFDGTNSTPGDTAVQTTSTGDAGKVPSCTVTLTNTEGTASTTITGEAISATVAQTYFPKAWQATVGSSNINSPSGSTILDNSTGSTRFTTAVWFAGSRINFHWDSTRSRVSINGDGVANIVLTLRDSSGADISTLEYGPADTLEFAWYMVSVDTTQAVEADRVKVYRRSANSLFPAEQLPLVSQTATLPQNAAPRLSRDVNEQRILSFDTLDGNGGSTFADYWHRAGVALGPDDFFDAGGYPVDVDTVGTPLIRIGGAHTKSDLESRANSGTGTDPLPQSGSVVFENVFDVNFDA